MYNFRLSLSHPTCIHAEGFHWPADQVISDNLNSRSFPHYLLEVTKINLY